MVLSHYIGLLMVLIKEKVIINDSIISVAVGYLTLFCAVMYIYVCIYVHLYIYAYILKDEYFLTVSPVAHRPDGRMDRKRSKKADHQCPL